MNDQIKKSDKHKLTFFILQGTKYIQARYIRKKNVSISFESIFIDLQRLNI